MIYLVAPNAIHPSGGVGVAAQWVRLLNEHGHEAMFITPNGDPSPYWLNFKVPAGSYADMKDEPGNKRVDIWMDCAMEFQTRQMRHYFFAQDVCQLEHIAKEKGQGQADRYRAHLYENVSLITLTHHAKWYYLYRYGIPSKVVNNFIDSNLFQRPDSKIMDAVCMIDHRDHFNPDIAEKLKKAGFTVKIARGTQVEIAQTMSDCLFFLSDVRGRWDGYEYSEGMPMPIMEAMASGCLVFCRDTNGVNEFILDSHNAFFFDDADLEERIRLMKDPEMEDAHIAMARAGAETIYGTFHADNTWKQIQEALELK
jgi:hypothetical protein